MPRRPRARLTILGVVACVVVVGLSPLLGRADVLGTYRPPLPPDGLVTGCYPLPGGVEPTFTYVLRHDGNVVAAEGIRRQVVLHVDDVDAATAAATLEEQFRLAGVLDEVSVVARDFEGVREGAVVRGELVLGLPAIGVQSDDAVCRNRYSTKRFGPDLPDRS